MRVGKQPNKVRGNIVQCPNFMMCSMCYGCRNYDSRIPECQECHEDGIREGENRNYNVCNTELHESWKVNRMTSKNTIKLDGDVQFKNGNENKERDR